MKKLKQWWRDITGQTHLENELLQLKSQLASKVDQINQLRDIIKEHTRIDADIDIRGGSYIIVSGKYRNNGYVRTFNINDSDFQRLVEQLKDMEKFYGRGQYDIAPTLRGVFRL